MSLYLDYNASAPILPEVLDTMIEAYKTLPVMPTAAHTYTAPMPKNWLTNQEHL